MCFLACVILRYTSVATLADCVAVNRAAEPFRSPYLQIMYIGIIGGSLESP